MSSERLRLKDRILDRIARAIKEIQGLQLGATNDTLVLNHEVRPVQKLIEHLDHALLHGLRRVSSGYWLVVPHFTRKDVIRQISLLPNITTDLGRGRAWLYIALNESVMESYLKCIIENKKLIRKYYVEHAIMRDNERLQVLQTLTAGLDFVTFDLDLSVPYLDLASYLPRKKKPDPDEEYDRISHHSIDTMSESSYTSGVQEDISSQFSEHTVTTPSDETSSLSSRDFDAMSSDFGFQSLASNDTIFNREDSVDSQVSTTKDAVDPLVEEGKVAQEDEKYESTEYKPQRPTSLGHVFRSNRIDSLTEAISGQTNLEVIHLNGKKIKKGKKKRKSPVGKVAVNTFDECLSQSNDLKVVVEEAVVWGGPTKPTSNEKDRKSLSANHVTEKIPAEEMLAKPANQNDLSAVNQNGLPNQIGDKSRTTNEVEDLTGLDAHVMNVKRKLANQAAILQGGNPQDLKQKDIETYESVGKLSLGPNLENVDRNKISDCIYQSDINDSGYVDQNLSDAMESESTGQVKSDTKLAVSQVNESATLPDDNVSDDDRTLRSDSVKVATKNLQISGKDPDSQGSQERDEEEKKKDKEKEIRSLKNDLAESDDCKMEISHEADMKIDNNTKLHLMLEVFKNESEEFQKLIRMTTGHMEGEIEAVFILLTDQSLYLLRRGGSSTTFYTEAVLPYNDLDYLSVGVNYQSITLVCTNRRNQYWLTTGDEALTRYFLSVLVKVMEQGSRTRELPSVLRDATTQYIAIKKFIAQERRCEVSDASLMLYSLVHWEDLSLKRAHDVPKAHSLYKEGALLYKAWDGSYLFGSYTWKPGFFLLRNGMFYRLLHRNDGVPQLAVSLKSCDFGGCRRIRGGDKPYSFELILPDKSSLELAANDDYEVSEWLHAICSAVSIGMEQHSPVTSPCIPCCMILDKQKLIVCHEDIQTGFFRCLGSCRIEDIGGISVDPANKYYCIVEFEAADMTSDHEQPWVLYFNSPVEEAKFESALGMAWKELFKVEVPLFLVDNKAIQSRCREQQNLLQTAWKKSEIAMTRKEFEEMLQ